MTGNNYCQKHNCKLEIKYIHEGTPYQDFDGYYCPECEKERKAYLNSPEYRAKLQMKRQEELRLRYAERKPTERPASSGFPAVEFDDEGTAYQKRAQAWLRGE